jgi:hypothetical protein
MSDLISELEADHRLILAHLESIKEAKFAREVAARELAAAKALIVAHLAKEDKELYRPLLANASAQSTAMQFQERMKVITTDVIAFFNTYDLSKAQDLGLPFVRDLGTIIGKLKTRMTQEEERLYVLFRQVAG